MERWEHNGVTAHGIKPQQVGTYEDCEPGGLIILGGSKLVWEDYKNAKAFFKRDRDYDIIGINDIAALFKAEPIQHIASLHPQMLGPLRQLREVRIHGHCHTHSGRAHDGVDIVWGNITTDGGTSGIFAVKIALAMGYKKIIVCGCGLDKTGHFYDPEVPEDNVNGWFDRACQMPWEDLHKVNEYARDRVRVMSGLLSKKFGLPTYNWIYGGI